MTVKEIIIRTLGSFKIIFDEKIVEEIEEEVMKQSPSKPVSLAYVISRNKAISWIKKQETQKKLAFKKLFVAEKERQYKEKFRKAEAEFREIIKKMPDKLKRGKKEAYLQFLYASIFQEKDAFTYEFLEKQFPDTTPSCYRKGVERARNLIRPYASKDLWEIVSKGMHRK